MQELRDFTFVHKYFLDEKQQSLWFLIIGIAAIALAVLFYFFIKTNSSFFKGAAIPLLAIGITQGIVGYTVYSRSDTQRMDVAYYIGVETTPYTKQMELPRMEKVMKNFTIYRYVEILLALAGLGLFLYFRSNKTKMFWKGLGLTLAIQALLMLGADYFAEKRGAGYQRELQKMMVSDN